MAVRTYGSAAIKLRNALECVEGYAQMEREGAEIPPADLILCIGEVTLAQDMLNDLLYAEAKRVMDAQQAERRELDRCRKALRDLGD